MPTTLRNTDILFNDGTTQSTAAGVPSSFNAIGSIVLAANFTASNYFPGNTVAGSNFLVATGFSTVTLSDSAFVEGPNNVSPHASWGVTGQLSLLMGFRNGNIGAWQPTNTATLPGTWRVLSASRLRYVMYFSYDNSTQIRYWPVFVQRVS